MRVNSSVVSVICLVVAIALCVVAAFGWSLGEISGFRAIFLALGFYFASELAW